MNKENEKKNLLTKNSVARLLVCQCLYMLFDENNDDKNIDNILLNINKNYVLKELNSDKYTKIYKTSFVKNLINYVIDNKEKLDNDIKSFLHINEPIETLDQMIIQILRTAIAESEIRKDLNKNIIINEYVDIASEFFDDAYIVFVNGILTNKFNHNNKITTETKIIQKIENKTLIIKKIEHKKTLFLKK